MVIKAGYHHESVYDACLAAVGESGSSDETLECIAISLQTVSRRFGGILIFPEERRAQSVTIGVSEVGKPETLPYPPIVDKLSYLRLAIV